MTKPEKQDEINKHENSVQPPVFEAEMPPKDESISFTSFDTPNTQTQEKTQTVEQKNAPQPDSMTYQQPQITQNQQPEYYSFNFEPFTPLQRIIEENDLSNPLPDNFGEEICPTQNIFGINDSLSSYISQNQTQTQKSPYIITPNLLPVPQSKAYKCLIEFCNSL